MLNRIHLLTAVCLTASAGLFVALPTMGQDMQRTTTVTGGAVMNQAMLPPGIAVKDLNADKGIEKAFKAISEDAIDKTGFDNLAAMLVEQDHTRIKQSLGNASFSNVDGNKNKQLTDLIASIESDWKAKFNTKFDIDYQKAFTTDFLHIQTGEVSDPEMLVGKWPVDANLMDAGAGKVSQADANQAKNKMFGGQVKLEKGRNVAIAHIPSGHGLNGLNASLIHEVTGWKFDVPNTLTAQKLYSNLVTNLTYVDQHKDQWPTDVNEAYREVTHAVTAALYDVQLTGSDGTAGMPNTVQPANANNR